MEKLPQKFSLQEFINSKRMEEGLEDSKRSDYSENDSQVTSAGTLEGMLRKVPDRMSLVEDLFNPDTKEENFAEILKKINEMNGEPVSKMGGYDTSCLTSSGKTICFNLYENGQFFAFENGKEPEDLPHNKQA